ncbi:MAG: hypothetical protein NC122_01770 [Faecalibacterium sp.]|nr:hypothetical protein [Ruminococcus sp.]MCM1391352.1 hypothetical protein [Ruminococcus sp.]MCM1484911.1 hypothetical protein [Faecalibacterium sp.]
MIVKYCPNCIGKPYTADLNKTVCPTCNSTLSNEFVDDTSLSGRLKLPYSSNFSAEETNAHNQTFNQSAFSGTPEFFTNNFQGNNSTTLDIAPKCNPIVNVSEPISVEEFSNNEQATLVPDKIIRGKVFQYSSTGKEDGGYRRLIITKLIDAIVYHQRFEDVLHRFTVRVNNGSNNLGFGNYIDIPVNVHGTIASGMQITDNCEVEVTGKYKNGVLMAQNINIVNNGRKSNVKFQRSISSIVYGTLAAIVAVFLIIFSVTSDGNFFQNIKSFLTTWTVVFVILLFLYFIFIFSRTGFFARMTSKKRRRFPFTGLLLASLTITMIILNCFGLGVNFSSVFSSLLSAIMPSVIIIGAIVYLIKIIIGSR